MWCGCVVWCGWVVWVCGMGVWCGCVVLVCGVVQQIGQSEFFVCVSLCIFGCVGLNESFVAEIFIMRAM